MVYVFRSYIDIYNVIYISVLLCCSFSFFHAFNARLLFAGLGHLPTAYCLPLDPLDNCVAFSAYP